MIIFPNHIRLPSVLRHYTIFENNYLKLRFHLNDSIVYKSEFDSEKTKEAVMKSRKYDNK